MDLSVKQRLEQYLYTLKELYGEIYQEVYGAERLGVQAPAVRGCRDRLTAMLNYLGDVSGKTVLDIGSNMGYFSLALADRGAYVISIEPNENFRRIQNLLAEQLGLSKRVVSLNLFLDYDAINFIKRNFAHFDIILMLSLWHHFVGSDRLDRLAGMPVIGKLVRKILEKKYIPQQVKQANDLCKEVFSLGETVIFDTGQSDEINSRHVHLLPDMGPHPGKWILENIFADKIYYDKEIIGQFVPHTSKNPRYLVGVKVKYQKVVTFQRAYESSPLDKEFSVDVERQVVLNASLPENLDFCDEFIMPYNCSTGESIFKFGGNLNDLLRAGAHLDYRYIAKRIVRKVFELHNKYRISHNDLRLWNFVFSLPEYDVYLIDFEHADRNKVDFNKDILMLRFILHRLAQRKGTLGIIYPENLERFVNLAVGDYAKNCKTEQDFIRFIESDKFYNV